MGITGFSFPTAIRFGPGARKEVAGHLRERGIKRPLIVTDKALAALPVLAEFRSHLTGLDVAVFGGVFGNPTASQVAAGAQAFKAHRADAVAMAHYRKLAEEAVANQQELRTELAKLTEHVRAVEQLMRDVG